MHFSIPFSLYPSNLNFARRALLWNCFLTETENDNKRPCARQQAAPRQMKLNLDQRNAPRLTDGTPATRPRMTAICQPAKVSRCHRFELHTASLSDCPAALVPGTLGRAEARATSAGSSGFDVDGSLSIDPACTEVPVAFDHDDSTAHISVLWRRSRSGATNAPFFSLFPRQRPQEGDVTKSALIHAPY
jgi:hypothetical protein